MAEAARPDITAGLVLGECNTGRLHVCRAKRGTPFRAGDGSVRRHTMLSEGAVSLSRYAWFVG
jgi:hypothetical protein